MITINSLLYGLLGGLVGLKIALLGIAPTEFAVDWNEIIFKMPGGVTQTIATGSILDRKKLTQSLMPQGLQLVLTPQELYELGKRHFEKEDLERARKASARALEAAAHHHLVLPAPFATFPSAAGWPAAAMRHPAPLAAG